MLTAFPSLSCVSLRICLFNRMAVDENEKQGRWAHVEKLLNRNGPFAHPDFEPGPDVSCLINCQCCCNYM